MLVLVPVPDKVIIKGKASVLVLLDQLGGLERVGKALLVVLVQGPAQGREKRIDVSKAGGGGVGMGGSLWWCPKESEDQISGRWIAGPSSSMF